MRRCVSNIMKLAAVLLVAIAACSPSSAPAIPGSPAAEAPLAVATDRGPVVGVRGDHGRAFRGIPFAAPPIGDLRWRPPADVTPWQTPRDATKNGHTCLQLDGQALRADSDEDCLTLQVWTPPGDPRGLPVMVWIPGGAFIQGGGSADLYDGAKLAAREGVIVVAINYRLGALGFFALAQPGQPTLPSMGLLDQRAALRWVQRNIGRFGGDAANVTIFGESAGAWSVCSHLVMPGSRGLFARAIMQSGSCADPLYFDAATAEAQGAALAKAVDCTDLACLRAKPAETIVRALPGRKGYTMPPGAWWGPVVDGVELPKQPLEILRVGGGAGVPLMIGWNRDEGALHALIIDEMTAAQLEQYVREAWGPRAVELLASYGLSAPKEIYDRVTTDGVFACEARRIARVLADRGVPVYQYEFVHALDDPRAHPLGATHTVDLWFIFDTIDGGVGLSPAEAPLSKLVQDAWGRFARTGDPNGPHLVWPRYTAVRDELLVIDYVPTIAAHVKQDVCDRWDRVELH